MPPKTADNDLADPPITPATTEPAGMTYAGSGVDIDAGDESARRIVAHMRRTYGPRVLGRDGAFAGCFRLDFNERLFKRNYRDPVLVACTDGVGTKVKLAIQLGVHDTIGQDCVAMNVNDLIVQGAEPLLFLDYIGTHKVNPANIEHIVKGVADGCELAGCALLGGETAEMPDIYDKDEYDLAGFAVGVVELSRVVDGTRVEEGDVILGLESDGVHSNGFSLIRAILREAKLDLKKTYDALETEQTLGQVLLTPTRIYAKQVVSLLRKYKVKKVVSGMSHITGGGLVDNLPRALGPDLNAKINTKAWTVPPIFKFLQQHGRVEDAEMWRVFNMGIGYCVIVRPHFAESAARHLERKGERVHVIGKVTKGNGRVVMS